MKIDLTDQYVYIYNCRFLHTLELKEMIIQPNNQITEEILKNIVRSTVHRIFELIQKTESPSHY